MTFPVSNSHQEKYFKRRFFMYYKIKKNKRSGCFVVTRNQYRNDSFRFETPATAKRVLQFDSALLVYAGGKYSLFLTEYSGSETFADPNYTTFIMEGISQYRVFRNSSGHKKCILALKIKDYWTFLVPESFRYFINTEKILARRLNTLPKIPATDSPAYFKKGFEDTLEFIFHANGKDYLIDPKNFDMTGTAAQIEVTEFSVITPLPPKCCFEATDGTNRYLFSNSCLRGKYPVLESFDEEKDYPEEFKSDYGYCGKDADGNILGLHIIDSSGSLKCCIESEKPMKSVHFYKRVYTSTNNAYFDIWQITYANGQKQVQIKTDGFYKHSNIPIDSDAWNF